VGVERALFDLAQKLRQRARRDAPAPVLPADPVADEALAVLQPADDVAGDGAVREDRPGHDRRIAERVSIGGLV